MKIAILNECFLGGKHLDRLKKLGQVSVYIGTKTEKEAVKRLKDVDVAVIHCSLLPITQNILKNASKLRYISLASTGYDRVDLKAAKENNVIVSNLPTYGTQSVAEHTFALIFAVIRKVVELDYLIRKDPYEINSINDLITSPYVGFTLHGKTLGLIGVGRIGTRVAEIAQALGMKVLAYDIIPKKLKGVEMKSIKEILKESDIVSLHTPLTKKTNNLIGKKELKMMKTQAILINTARGGLIETQALYSALKNRTIAGAGIDVLKEVDKSNPLLKLKNIVFTPHSAWYTKESFENIANTVVENVEAYINGKPINILL